jgi:hypothetical protein
MFDIVQKSTTFLLEIMTLVSLASTESFGMVFFVGERSLVYIVKSNNPRTDPLGTPSFTVLQFQKKFCY